MSVGTVYQAKVRPFETRRLDGGRWACMSPVGEVAFLDAQILELLRTAPEEVDGDLRQRLKAKHFLTSSAPTQGLDRLYASRLAEKAATAAGPPALHILVPTLQCAHSCQYCQVSRALDEQGFSMSQDQMLAACDTIMASAAETLTVEFQGGDPLNRFDLIQLAIEALAHHPARQGRAIRFVIASTLHQLTDQMCSYLRQYDVKLSTSIDGPAWLHNKNRPLPTRDSYARTLQGIELARAALGPDSVSALMTTTHHSLDYAEAIVDEYVALGLQDVFIRPLSPYGFAKRNLAYLGYSTQDFMRFYERAVDRVLWWNGQGVAIREAYAGLILNKLISSFDAGYVDLQSPNTSGRAVLVYNYDGWVYPSDEARMLAETGDTSFRMGVIGTPLEALLSCDVSSRIANQGDASGDPDCRACAFKRHCAPSPVDAAALAQGGHAAPTRETEHCRRQTAMFDFWLHRLCDVEGRGDTQTADLLARWAQPSSMAGAS